ncbi:speriolin-like protein [Labeo rohita]|uniref:speriolin-like protein n=1 Tax=Labeo rohita TaxID=84645 RepID=UPI0021E1D97B|nr:speriolin-like protein [Labeo rohita]
MSEENHHKLWRELKELKMSHLDGEENTDANSFTSTDGLMSHSGRRSDIEWKDSVDESRFRDELLKRPHKTSSRLNLLHTDALTSPPSTFNNDEPPVCSFRQQGMRVCLIPADPSRLLGEIAFQLDRRILSHVFQEQSRLYGFTVQNILDKIQQVIRNYLSHNIYVCVHPLSGTVDELYRIMDGLHVLGYSTSLHPAFSELVVNAFGILKEPPDALDPAYSDPIVLRRVVVDTAPSRLMKDLLLLLDCLCFMARRDGRPLFLW